MMKPHPRIDKVGRVCMICGRGQRPKLGGCWGATNALLAFGYEWDARTSIGFAHLPCLINKAKEQATEKKT